MDSIFQFSNRQSNLSETSNTKLCSEATQNLLLFVFQSIFLIATRASLNLNGIKIIYLSFSVRLRYCAPFLHSVARILLWKPDTLSQNIAQKRQPQTSFKFNNIHKEFSFWYPLLNSICELEDFIWSKSYKNVINIISSRQFGLFLTSIWYSPHKCQNYDSKKRIMIRS